METPEWEKSKHRNIERPRQRETVGVHPLVGSDERVRRLVFVLRVRNPINGASDIGSEREKFLQQSGGLRVGEIPQQRASTP